MAVMGKVESKPSMCCDLMLVVDMELWTQVMESRGDRNVVESWCGLFQVESCDGQVVLVLAKCLRWMDVALERQGQSHCRLVACFRRW